MKQQPRRYGKRRGKKAEPSQPLDVLLEQKRRRLGKLIHKEVKNAKQLEIRKVIRRIKQAKDDAAGGDAAVKKLEAVLAAARAVDVAQLAARAAEALLREDPAGEEAAAEAGASSRPVEDRILAAKCVREQVAAGRKELQDLRQAGEKGGAPAPRAAAAKASAGAGRGAEADDPGDESPGEPDEAASSALQKLLAGRRADSGSDGGGGSSSSGGGGEASDSGACSGSFDLGQYSDDDDDDGGDTGAAEAGPGTARKPGGAERQVPQAAKKQPKQPAAAKKPKNRLGQRARQQLAERLHGTAARHIAVKRAEAAKPRPAPAPQRNPGAAAAPPLDEAALHPSWAAKRQQRQLHISVAPSSNKKIVFDETGAAAAPAAAGGRASRPAPAPGRAAAAGKEAAAAGLHPSWAARKLQRQQAKQAVIGSAPKRQKVTFSDSE